MLRIYLDQAKWIDLARATNEHRLGERFDEALAVCRAGVAADAVSFPLDMYRYWETAKRNDDGSRTRLAQVMSELSRMHTMALPGVMLDQEIDLALQRRFGRPERPRLQQVFGVGMRHIAASKIAWPEPDLSPFSAGPQPVPLGLRAQLTDLLNEEIERQLLRAGPADFLASGGVALSDSDHAQRFVSFENGLATTIAQRGWTGKAIDLAVLGSDFADIRPVVIDALTRIGITYEQFVENLGGSGVLSFLDDLPTRYVTNVMRSAKHRQTQQPWTPNDFFDVVALPVAAVYCDVLVTEKQWVREMQKGKVGERYDTILLHDVAELKDVIVAASTN